ncbi:MAG TPA: hypothetical protein VFK44_07940 [Bacillales bacterium]|nr:hypothetical protein [Bacillales bacterium]
MSGNIAPVLSHYQLYPNVIESFGNVHKISGLNGVFALKQTMLTQEQRAWFAHIIDRLKGLSLDSLLLPLPTKTGQPFVMEEGMTYYLTTWCAARNDGIVSEEERALETAAVLHQLTEKEQSYSADIVESSSRLLLDRWSKQQDVLETFAAETENRLTFTAFERSFLSARDRIFTAVDRSKQRLSAWKTTTNRNRRFRVVLCHGQLTPAHAIDGHLVNFERALLDAPSRDLAQFFRSAVLRANTQRSDAAPYDWLLRYEEIFPLRVEERQLLAAYLSFPDAVYQVVRRFIDQEPRNNSEFAAIFDQRWQRFLQLEQLADKLSE